MQHDGPFHPYGGVKEQTSWPIYSSKQYFHPRGETYWRRAKIFRTEAFMEHIAPLLSRIDMDQQFGIVSARPVIRPVPLRDVDALQRNLPGIKAWHVIWLLRRYLDESNGPFRAIAPTVAKVAPDLWLVVFYDSRLEKWVLDIATDDTVRLDRVATLFLVY